MNEPLNILPCAGSLIPQDRLKRLLHYNEKTGVFIWHETRGRTVAGSIAGSKTKDGYIQICIGKSSLSAHRLAWLYVNGKWPDGQIDHINRDRSDNRFSNLRLLNASENQQNSGLSKRNKTGHKGVQIYKPTGKYISRIGNNGKSFVLGYFDTPEQAAQAYANAAAKLHKYNPMARNANV